MLVAEQVDEFLDQNLAQPLDHVSPSCQRLVERSFSQEHHDQGISDECNQRTGESAEAAAAQKYALQYDYVVARGDDVGERLYAKRHLLDWKRESRQQERGQEGGHQTYLARGKLILRDDGDPESKPQNRGQVNSRADGQRGERTAKGDLKPPYGDRGANGGIEHAEGEVGKQFADDDFERGYGSRDELFHRAALPLARDGQRREQHSDDSHHDRGDTRYDEVFALEVLVEPGADFNR